MSTSDNENVLDDNKLDFELLTRRRQTTTSSASTSPTADVSPRHASTASLSTPSPIGESNDMIWPLHLAPTFISHYVTGDVIGHGSYAEVRECVDTRNLERGAMKIINKNYLMKQAPQALTNQLQETRLLKHLKHAHIISMKECLNQGGNVYIVMEYCAFSLEELLRDQDGGKFRVSIARRFFHQLCLAVDYLHSVGVVHRDLKPQNMLLTNCGCLKLIDFGVSHVLSMWNLNDLCSNYEGTPLFQAPEIVVGGREYKGFKADVWSCGVTLFLLLYGQYPFDDEGLLGLYDKILGEELKIPESAPTSLILSDLLVLMLDKDCSRRADVEQVLAHPWMKLLGSPDDCDDIEFMEFFNLVSERHNDQRKRSDLKLDDVYKSMTVLPYLYQHHFPDLPIRRPHHDRSSSSDRGVIITKINPLESTVASNDPDHNTSTHSTVANSTSSSASNEGSHGIVDDDSQQIEWGTREQYNLLKVPQIRANRIRCGIASRSKWRREIKRTRHRKSS